MMAAVFKGEGHLKIEEVDVPKIQNPDDIIVKIELCSICGTDVHIMSVPPGYAATPDTVLGHELVGEIVAVGDGVKTVKVGDSVVSHPNDYCGVCKYCKMNLPNFCENIKAMGIDVDGGFAEYVKITEKVAYKIADDLPAEIAAFAEPLACFMNGRQKLKIKPGDSVLICGAGAIGLMAVQIMKNSGANPIIVSEPSESRRKIAKETGADIVVDPFNENLNEIVMKATGIGVDFALDVVGSQVGACLENTRKSGTVLLFGINGKAEMTLHQMEITTREIAILGTWLANATFPVAVKILESGSLNLKPLITHTIPLDKVLEGIELLGKGEGIEILIDPSI
jgi:2-desacetyl-2-hydroxyethyl bacteriochlorophyllide A dehydrogenase